MNYLSPILAIPFGLLIFITGCNSKNFSMENSKSIEIDQNEQASLGIQPFNSLASIRITDYESNPIANAKVLFGDGINSPFQNNLLTSGQEGFLSSPAGWNRPMAVTIEAEGYIRATYLEQEPNGQTFRLHRSKPKTTFELKGVATGLKVVNDDDFVNFGMVLPAMTRKEIFNFDMARFMSAQKDEMSVAGKKVRVPSNLSIPKQRESYFIPVTIEKPIYHVNFSDGGTKRVFIAGGKFPFTEVVDQLTSKVPFADLINYFELQSGGIVDVNLKDPSTTVNLPVNQFTYTKKHKVIARGIEDDEFILAAGISDYDGYLLPTDIKRLYSGEKNSLGTIDKRDAYLVAALKRKTEFKKSSINGIDRVSVSLSPFSEVTVPDFLPLIEDPQVTTLDEVKIQPIKAPSQIVPLGTIMVLSTIEEPTESNKNINTSNQVWEIFSPRWEEHVKLPNWPLKVPDLKKRWDIGLVGGKFALKTSVNEVDLFDNATHVTHSSAEF